MSTARVDTMLNHLIKYQTSNGHQMRWSLAGAHYLLQVRTEICNGRRLGLYHGLHEWLRTRMEHETAG
jgi:hypothetical protein